MILRFVFTPLLRSPFFQQSAIVAAHVSTDDDGLRHFSTFLFIEKLKFAYSICIVIVIITPTATPTPTGASQVDEKGTLFWAPPKRYRATRFDFVVDDDDSNRRVLFYIASRLLLLLLLLRCIAACGNVRQRADADHVRLARPAASSGIVD